MKNLLLTLTLVTAFAAQASELGYRQCATWDTFCKNPNQIVATKCRLGVPVFHDQCATLGQKIHYSIRGAGSLQDGLPVSDLTGSGFYSLNQE